MAANASVIALLQIPIYTADTLQLVVFVCLNDWLDMFIKSIQNGDMVCKNGNQENCKNTSFILKKITTDCVWVISM